MCGDFTWRVSDCEELVGVTQRGWWGCHGGIFILLHEKFQENFFRTICSNSSKSTLFTILYLSTL